MPKDILAFLFNDSFALDGDEAVANMFEHLAEVGDLEVKKEPLEKALKKFGFDGEVGVSDSGAVYAELGDEEKYRQLVKTLEKAETLTALAELGWVANLGNDVASNCELPVFKVFFVDVTEVEPSDADPSKLDDLEKLVSKSYEDDVEGKPEGIGSDLKPGSAALKGGKVPAAQKVKSAMKS